MNYLFLIAAYLMGSIPFSVIVSRLKGINILEHGSKNAGATNVYRVLGIKYALPTFLLDAGKGFLAIYIARQLAPDNHLFIMLSGFCAILGHTFTPFLKFKGGKGVATGIGVLTGIAPAIAAAGFVCEFLIIFTTRYVSLASIISALLVLALVLTPVFGLHIIYQIFIAIIVIYIIYKHIPNIKRLMEGKENRL